MYKIKSIAILHVIVLGMSLFQGCNRTERPTDLPKLYPCEIVVLAEGKPLREAQVSLYKNETDFKWGIGSITDEAGTARMVTHGRYPGVPEGDYRVVVVKQERDRIEPTKDSSNDSLPTIRRGTNINVYTWIDPVYAEGETTPLTITVSKKKTKQEFDVGKTEKKVLRTEPAN